MLRVGRNREIHKRMPKGWAPSASGVIYFRPTNAGDKAIVKTITGGPLSLRLGATHDEAAEAFARLIVAARQRETQFVAGTVGELVDRARRELVPRIKSDKTKTERTRHIDALEKLFGAKRFARSVYEATKAAPGTFLVAMDIQRHLDACADSRPVAANREVKTWEIVFADARRRWGLTEYNPCAGLSLNPEAPRDVLPVDALIFGKVYRELDPPMRFMVAMIRFYGRRKGECLGLTLSSAQDDGLHLQRGKRRKELVIRWDGRLDRMWGRLMRWRAAKTRGGKLQTTMAIVNRRGRRFTVTGFNSAWRRAMKAAGIKGAFTFHDIRATRASTLSQQQAVEVLAHDDPRTTAGVYRRGPHIIDLRAPVDSRNDSRKFPKKAS
jgi:hypothetical protein